MTRRKPSSRIKSQLNALKALPVAKRQVVKEDKAKAKAAAKLAAENALIAARLERLELGKRAAAVLAPPVQPTPPPSPVAEVHAATAEYDRPSGVNVQRSRFEGCTLLDTKRMPNGCKVETWQTPEGKTIENWITPAPASKPAGIKGQPSRAELASRHHQHEETVVTRLEPMKGFGGFLGNGVSIGSGRRWTQDL